MVIKLFCMSDKLKPVQSSLLQAYSYDSDSLELTVIYKDGTQIKYKNVPPPVMSQVFDSPGSIGSKFLKLISRRFKSINE